MPERQAQTHSRRKLAFTNLDQVQEDAQSLLKSGYVRLGNWDLGQCCTHLAIAMDLSIDGFPAALPPPISTINHWTFFRYRWIRSLVGSIRVPSFSKAIPPPQVDDEDGVGRLIAAIGRITQPDAVFRRNPFLGRMTQEEWLTFHAFHANRHLSFLIPAFIVEVTDQAPGNRGQTTAPT